MSTTERRYPAFEAAYLLRLLLGPEFGNFYTLMADQRRGKPTPIPNIRHYRGANGVPYYRTGDLLAFVDEIRSNPLMRVRARAQVKPTFNEYDLEREMAL